MKFNKSLLIAALSLLAVSGLIAKENPKKDNVPGVAPQPAEFFYTGKPYDADLGAYTFNYRNYDPELKRWTCADPSGFPDGANTFLYVKSQPLSQFDAHGLATQNINLNWGVTAAGLGINRTLDNIHAGFAAKFDTAMQTFATTWSGVYTYQCTHQTQSCTVTPNTATGFGNGLTGFTLTCWGNTITIALTSFTFQPPVDSMPCSEGDGNTVFHVVAQEVVSLSLGGALTGSYELARDAGINQWSACE